MIEDFGFMETYNTERIFLNLTLRRVGKFFQHLEHHLNDERTFLLFGGFITGHVSALWEAWDARCHQVAPADWIDRLVRSQVACGFHRFQGNVRKGSFKGTYKGSFKGVL